MRSGITRRWLRGNLLITVLVVLLAEAMFLYSYTRSYYGSVQQIMYRRFSSVTGQLKMYTGDTAQSAAASRSLALRRMVEQFADKDKYEFMLLDSYGGVIASSSGTDAEGIVSSKDFEQALNGPDGLGVAVYRTQSGEVVMAACSLVPYDAEDVAALRLVTSLALVERQVKNAIIISVFLAVAILLFTIMSGLYFVRGIVVPLGQVERTAAGIARGELDVRLPLTGDPHDEVDRLRGTINQMAEGLEETEKMKNEFISSVSHELRTPLTSIRGWVETLMTLDDPTDENYRKGLEIINNETGRLNNMVEELLDFSRLQNGRIRMECRPLDLVAEAFSLSWPCGSPPPDPACPFPARCAPHTGCTLPSPARIFPGSGCTRAFRKSGWHWGSVWMHGCISAKNSSTPSPKAPPDHPHILRRSSLPASYNG